jgi:HSP20 family protein
MSNEDDDQPEWSKRKRLPFSRDWGFGDIDDIFREMEKLMEEELENFTSRVPKDYVKERKLPDGSTARELGPFVYGYSMKIGPDGKPEVREFGNVKPGLRGPEVKEEREPLVDVYGTEREVHVVAELPGVDKKDINLHGTEDSLTISVDTPEYKYYKDIALPARVRVREARTQYKNGVLEVTFPRLDDTKKPKGESIRID